MRDLPPPAPDFGAAVHTPPEAPFLTQIAHRRSASAQALQAPGPSADELDAILRLSARAPDHGKLFPWRFIVLEGEAKARLAERLTLLAGSQADPEKAKQALRKLTAPPLAVVVISRVETGKIPEWEQVLSAGSVCTLMLLAAQGFGYGANWITDWYSYDAGAADFQSVLIAEDRMLANRRLVASLESRRFVLNVALVRALGGGWQDGHPRP